jgi:uncharacterized protein (TIGR00725 family)
MSDRRYRCIAVCGPRDASEPQLALAERLGAAVAQAGCALVCGGLGGVMQAAARGAAEAAGDGAGANPPPVIGIVPDEQASSANPYCSIVVPSGMGVARNVLIVRMADAVVLCGGGSGTLSEAALAWQLNKPVIAVAHSGGWAEKLGGIKLDDRGPSDHRCVLVARDPEAAVRTALAELEK